MKQYLKSAALLLLLSGTVLFSFADRGIRKKAKSKVSLHVPVSHFKPGNLFQTGNGLQYKGGLVLDKKVAPVQLPAVMAFQKGNTYYLVPNQYKAILTEVNPGYTGMKLVIKPH